VTRRLAVSWPDARPFAGRGGRPIRLLAVSDDVDPALAHAVNRQAIGDIDAIVGCGDLEPDYLAFLADAFKAPLGFVRGNHDRGGQWEASRAGAPTPLATGGICELGGLVVVALEWPGARTDEALRHDRRAWGDVLRAVGHLAWRRLTGRGAPVLVISHAPPLGSGDEGVDAYHRGFGAYRWLIDRVRPPLWLHGHVTPATVADWRCTRGPTTLANVTGAVVIEIAPPGTSEGRPGDGRPGEGGEREPA
jgi:hypothetical protein